MNKYEIVAKAAENYVQLMFTAKNGEAIKLLRKALEMAGMEYKSK